MIDLNLFIVFDAIYTTGSVKEAAERLNVSPPAISHSLSKLREIYNEPLFVREGRGLKATSFASELHKSTKDHLSYLVNSQNLFSDFNSEKTNRIFKIGTESDLDLVFYPQLLKEMELENNDGLSVQKYTEATSDEDIKNALRLRKIDIVLTTIPINERSYINEKIASEKIVVAVRKGHPRIKENDTLTKEMFFSEKHTSWRNLRGEQMVLESLSTENLPKRDIVYTAESNLNLLYMTMNQDWLSVTTESLIDIVSPMNNLNVFKPPFEMNELPLYVTYHKAFEKDKGIQWLIQKIKDSLGK